MEKLEKTAKNSRKAHLDHFNNYSPNITFKLYYSRLIAYSRRLEEWCHIEEKADNNNNNENEDNTNTNNIHNHTNEFHTDGTQWDAIEVLYLLNQLVQSTISDAMVVPNLSDRNAIVENAKSLIATGSYFLYTQEMRY